MELISLLGLTLLVKGFYTNTSSPNTDEPDFYIDLLRKLKELKNRHVIIVLVGDWNLLLDPCVDGRNYQHINNKKAKDSVHNLIAELDLFDIWRSENPEHTKYTWRRTLANKELQMGRLNFFLISLSVSLAT